MAHELENNTSNMSLLKARTDRIYLLNQSGLQLYYLCVQKGLVAATITMLEAMLATRKDCQVVDYEKLHEVVVLDAGMLFIVGVEDRKNSTLMFIARSAVTRIGNGRDEGKVYVERSKDTAAGITKTIEEWVHVVLNPTLKESVK